MRRVLLPILCAAAVTACTQTFVVPYDAGTTARASGRVAVLPFDYHAPKGVAPHQILNTAPAVRNASIQRPVDHFVADAVRQELLKAGVTASKGYPATGRSCLLQGTVKTLQVSPVEHGTAYESVIRYVLADANNRLIHDTTKAVRFADVPTDADIAAYKARAAVAPTAPQADIAHHVAADQLSKVLADNIGQLMRDEDFLYAIARRCRG